MAEDTLIGQQIGPYLIQAKIGEGGMARVYKGYHARLRREVAIKVIASQIADKADFQVRFEREAQLIASLEHHNIVAVYDFGDVSHLTYLVMQYVGGGTLLEQLQAGQQLSAQRAAQYALQMAHALHHAHQRGIVHRDVKPQNMLVSASDPNQLLLSDFGIAKLFDNSPEATQASVTSSHQPGMTSVGQIIGTAQYMAPEQVQGQMVDARTDVYALGAVLYQMLTGRTPFQANTAIGLMYQHINSLPRPVRTINPNVPESLAWITAKALEKAPEARFQTAEAMAQVLEAAINAAEPQNRGQISALQTQITSHTSQPYAPYQAPTTATSVSVHTPMPQTTAYTYTNALRSSTPSPALRRAQLIATPILILLILSVLVWRIFLPTLFQQPGGHAASGNTTAITDNNTFPEHSSNLQNWITGNQDGLDATINQNKYQLIVDDGNTHFPYPRALGALAKNFTWMATITQTAGGSDSSYGLAFNLTPEGASIKSSYAFVIDGSGNYAFLKYTDPNSQPETLGGHSTAIHTQTLATNMLKVIDKQSEFQFFVNGQPMTINGKNTLTDTSYQGGVVGLLVAGQNASYTATQAQLTTP